MITRYQERISGPILGRIDIHIEVPRVDYEKLSNDRLWEPSAQVQACVETARERQRVRFNGSRNPEAGSSNNGIACANMPSTQIQQYCQLDCSSSDRMRSKMNYMQLSTRAYHRVLKLAHTITNLAGESNISRRRICRGVAVPAKDWDGLSSFGSASQI